MAEFDQPEANFRERSIRISVWDLPTRLFHWSLVTLIALAWWSGEEEWFDVHFWAGYAILFLIVFRLLWGLFGSSTARFAGFIRGPAGIFSYLRNPNGWKAVGHSPIGALSVAALLGLVAAMVATGLVQSEKEHGEWIVGPLAYLVSEDVSAPRTTFMRSPSMCCWVSSACTLPPSCFTGSF